MAVAGAIALQMVFTGIQDEFKQDTGADLDRASLYAELDTRGGGPAATARGAARRAAAPGVRRAVARRCPSTTSAVTRTCPSRP